MGAVTVPLIAGCTGDDTDVDDTETDEPEDDDYDTAETDSDDSDSDDTETEETREASIELIDENPDAGFHFPYLLFKPELSISPDESGSPSDETRPLLVRCSPRREEESMREERLEAGRGDIENGRGRFIAEELGTPAVVGLLPSSPDDGSFGNLDHNSLQVTDPPLERLDLQLLAMIEDAQDRLSDEPYDIPDTVHMDGFSVNGEFLEQFTMLHPERVNAVSTGGNGFITIPRAELADDFPTVGDPETDSLPWPIGVADLDDLVGDEFNDDAWMTTEQFRYIGADDQWDPDEQDHPREYRHAQRYTGLGEERQQLLLDIFGWEQVDERFETSRAIYDAIGAPTEFRIYDGVEHEIPEEILIDIVEFHREQLEETYGS